MLCFSIGVKTPSRRCTRREMFTGQEMEAEVAILIIKNVAALTGQVISDQYPEIDAEIPKNNFFEELRLYSASTFLSSPGRIAQESLTSPKSW